MKKEGTMSTCHRCGNAYYAPPAHREKRKFCSIACKAESQRGIRSGYEARFWKKVDKTDSCWLWTGSKNSAGYGQVRIGGRGKMTHRMAYEWLVGEIPEGLFLLHSCDTPACCNPAHLSTGNQKENMQDAIAKGRHYHGERHWAYKLSVQAIKDIRTAHLGGATGRAIAKHFSISEGAVSMILSGKARKQG